MILKAGFFQDGSQRIIHDITLPKTNISHLKWWHPKRKAVFQSAIIKGPCYFFLSSKSRKSQRKSLQISQFNPVLRVRVMQATMSFLCPFDIRINLLKLLRNVLMSVCLQKDELEQEAPYSAYLVAWIGGLGCDAVRWWCVRNPVRWSPVEGTVVEIPLFTRFFIHPNGGWEWDCVHEQYVKICSNFCGADFSWWSRNCRYPHVNVWNQCGTLSPLHFTKALLRCKRRLDTLYIV